MKAFLVTMILSAIMSPFMANESLYSQELPTFECTVTHTSGSQARIFLNQIVKEDQVAVADNLQLDLRLLDDQACERLGLRQGAGLYYRLVGKNMWNNPYEKINFPHGISSITITAELWKLECEKS